MGEIIKPEVADGLVHDVCIIIEQTQKSAYLAVNEMLIKRNWLLGMRIQHEVLKDQRAEYGEQVIKTLAKKLTERYGRGFKKGNLYMFVSFYLAHPDIFQSVTGKSEIVKSVSGLSEITDLYGSLKPTRTLRLSWSHYSIILQEPTMEGRAWYENEASNEMWSTRTLQRNVSSQYYHRLLRSQNKAVVHDELVRPEGHNPTIGLLLCADTDEDVAHYSVLNNNDQLFAAKYLTYMPTKEELRREI